jgi:hypothetical protein
MWGYDYVPMSAIIIPVTLPPCRHRRLDIPFGVEVERGAALFKLASGTPMREFAGVMAGRAALSRLSVLIGNFVLCVCQGEVGGQRTRATNRHVEHTGSG